MAFPTTAVSSADGTTALASFGGSVTAFTTLNAATVAGAGSVADFGSAVNNITMALSGTATSVEVDLEGSVDNVNWFKLKTDTAATVVTPRVVGSSLTPCRYVRGRVVGTVTGGNVTAKLMAAE